MPRKRRATLIRGRVTSLVFLLALPLVVVPSTADAATIELSPRWQAMYPGPGDDGDDFARLVGLSPDGSRVVIAGNSGNAGPRAPLLVVAYDSTSGVELWSQRFLPRSENRLTALAVTDSRVFVASDREFPRPAQVHSLALGDGRNLWSRYMVNTPTVNDLAVGTGPREGWLFLTGETGDAAFRPFVSAIRTSDGVRVWRTLVPVDRGWGDDLELHGRDLFFGGGSYVPSDESPHTRALVGSLDPSGGRLRWTSGFAVGRVGYGSQIAVSPDGSQVFATASLWCPSPGDPYTGFDDWLTAGFRGSDGRRRWLTRFPGPQVDSNEDPTDIVADAKRVYVGGSSDAGMAVAAYDPATGDELWSSYHGPSAQGGVTFGLDIHNGPLVAVGATDTMDDYRAFGLNASTGEELWSSLLSPYVGSRSARANDVVISTDGTTAYVTGWVENPVTRDPETLTAAFDLAS